MIYVPYSTMISIIILEVFKEESNAEVAFDGLHRGCDSILSEKLAHK